MMSGGVVLVNRIEYPTFHALTHARAHAHMCVEGSKTAHVFPASSMEPVQILTAALYRASKSDP